MVQKVTRLDLGRGVLEAARNFSRLKYDIWVEDHKPFKFIKNPPVAGIMAIETFMETAKLLYPYLNPVGVREVEYKGLLEVPFGQEVEARLACKKVKIEQGETICSLDLESRDISAKGRKLDRWTTNYSGQTILAAGAADLDHLPDFPINPKELTTRSLEHADVVKYYGERSSMTGRLQGSSLPGRCRFRRHQRTHGVRTRSGFSGLRRSRLSVSALSVRSNDASVPLLSEYH